MTDKSTLKLIEAIRANQLYVADEVVHSAAERISTLINERDAEKARADRLEAALREIGDIAEISGGGEFYITLVDRALKGEQ